MYEHIMNRSVSRLVAAVAVMLATTSCGMDTEGPDEGAELGQGRSAIINGDPVASPDIHVSLAWAGNSGCSGTLLNDRWIISAKHCFGPGSFINEIIRGSDKRGIARVVSHPSRDIALVEASSPFPDVWPTSMYPRDPETLVGQVVTCYGYGAGNSDGSGGGTLRQGNLRVRSVQRYWQGDRAGQPSHLDLVPADARAQISGVGDSGGGCFLNNKSRALVGVCWGGDSRSTSNYIPTSIFSQWALPIISPASQRLICHGRECVTNPRPLPHKVGQEVAWRPCSGELSAPGNYFFDYDISYDMEYDFDKILLDGVFLTGAGTKQATTYASHLGHRVGVYTDYSVESNGISWLRARCPNDP